jgi:pilus assembly protein FimV
MTTEDLPIPMSYWLASGGLVLLGLSALLYRLRRKPGEPDTEASKSDRLKPQTAEAAAPAAGPKPAESPTSGTAEVTEIHPDQLDPAWEADVYLRYGRYPQAEALIRASLKKEPDREDLKLKLCEILNLSHQNEAFSAYVRELQGMGPRLSDGFWSSVQAMRPELIDDAMPQPAHAVEPDRSPSEPSAVEMVGTLALPPTADLETLDLEDTDFSAELLALEAQLGGLNEPGAAHPMDAMRPEAVSLSTLDDDQSLEQALEALTDLRATPAADVDAEASTLDLAEPSLVTDALSPQAPEITLEGVDLHQGDELADLERLLDPTAPLVNPAQEPTPIANHADATDSPPLAEAADSSTAPPLPEEDNLLEFVPPIMAELLPAPPGYAPEPRPLVLENLISFDTAGVSTAPALPTRTVATPVPASSFEPVASVRNDELDFENLPAFSETSDAPENAGFGVLDFELDLLDPLTQAASDPEPTAENDLKESSPLDMARRLAEDGDKIAARKMLKELIQAGDASAQIEARLLLEEISKVRLSLVSGPASEAPPETPFVPPAKATPGA